MGNFCKFVFNSQTGEFCTRTPASWAKIGLFYLIYYSGLAAFFAGMLAAFLWAFTDEKAPTLTGSSSVLPPNPGMGFRPRPDVDRSLIKYSVGHKDYVPFVVAMDEFLEPNNTAHNYKKGQGPKTHVDCSSSKPEPASYTSKPCRFLIDDYADLMKECVNDGTYGYEKGSPCVAIKMNKIFEFVPELSNGTGKYLKIECQGEHSADMDNIGPLKYFPKPGIDLHYFPYVGQPNYISPLVFVKLERPVKGVLIQVVCKPVNADNIVQDKLRRGDGRVHFEVIIDE